MCCAAAGYRTTDRPTYSDGLRHDDAAVAEWPTEPAQRQPHFSPRYRQEQAVYQGADLNLWIDGTVVPLVPRQYAIERHHRHQRCRRGRRKQYSIAGPLHFCFQLSTAITSFVMCEIVRAAPKRRMRR